MQIPGPQAYAIPWELQKPLSAHAFVHHSLIDGKVVQAYLRLGFQYSATASSGWQVAVFYRYDDAILGTQSTVNGAAFNYNFGPPNGSTWQWSGGTNGFTVRENDGATNFNGDPTNETISTQEQIGGPWEQVVAIDGVFRQTIYDFTFSVTDGTTTYQIAVIDVDLNNDDDVNDVVNGDNEDGYYLVFTNGIPPQNTPLTVSGIVDNSTSIAHATLGGEVVCFAKGTQILTPDGPMPIETLEIGMQVTTQDHGNQPLRWIGRTTVPCIGKLAPIVFQKGALGNHRDLVVSPQHRMLISDWRAQLYLGVDECLIAAKDLVNGDTIYRRPGGLISYYHLLLDRHEILLAEGIPAESLYLGQIAQNVIDLHYDSDFADIFGHLPDHLVSHTATARRCMRSREGSVVGLLPAQTTSSAATPCKHRRPAALRLLISRHLKTK
ncbi:Hint domain-containing protein [Actibacterium ureilyticum]|uniref:Hint domain-containing protein n=1 Tax=Actibacterium ureilyticum TaxID=1590614 RepID=UPI001140E0FA|nr:Hint domain-containing protein [Actibacterium ureilyticum]